MPTSTLFLVNVTMMCGCPIGNGLDWIPADFDVTATIELLGSAASPTTFPLTLLQDPSIFFAPFAVESPGFYLAAITAVQKSTGNTGTATVTFFTKT